MAAPESLSREKRAAILAGAARVFFERGYEGASMSMITAAAGVSKGTIYQHFPGKAALFAATIAREAETRLAHLFEGLDHAADITEALNNIGQRFVHMLTDQQTLAIERMVVSEAAHFPALAETFYAAGPGPAVATMARYLAAQADAGRMVIADPAFAAEQFFTLCQARVVLRARLRLPVSADEKVMVVAQAVGVFLRAFRVGD